MPLTLNSLLTLLIGFLGETIEGVVTCKPNEKNPRDLDISMRVDFDGAAGSYHRNEDYKLR